MNNLLESIAKSLAQLVEDNKTYLRSSSERDRRLVEIAEINLQIVQHYYGDDIATGRLPIMDKKENQEVPPTPIGNPLIGYGAYHADPKPHIPSFLIGDEPAYNYHVPKPESLWNDSGSLQSHQPSETPLTIKPEILADGSGAMGVTRPTVRLWESESSNSVDETISHFEVEKAMWTDVNKHKKGTDNMVHADMANDDHNKLVDYIAKLEAKVRNLEYNQIEDREVANQVICKLKYELSTMKAWDEHTNNTLLVTASSLRSSGTTLEQFLDWIAQWWKLTVKPGLSFPQDEGEIVASPWE